MDGFTVSPGAVDRAAQGIGALASRVETFHRSTRDVTRSLTPAHAWGVLRPLREHFLSLAADFERHLEHMSGAVDGAKRRLDDTAGNYSQAEKECLRALARAGEEYGEGQRLRRLNPASRFYQEHRLWNGVITSLPSSAGALGSTVLHSWRFVGDLRSDDRYNIGTDIAMLATDASTAFMAGRSDLAHIRADPIGFLLRTGVPFLLNAFYWTKSVTDELTGDPIATGQAAYGFDSIAEGCRRLAADLGETVDRTLGGAWHGTAADIARQRLTAMREGIADTGRGADRIAALLQLVSSLITDVEAVIRSMITDAITWAIVMWFSAHLAAAETFGASEAVAAQRITAQSAQTAGDVGRVMTSLTGMLRRINGLVGRLRTELARIKERSFAALLRSSSGTKFVESLYGGGRQTTAIIREDAVRGRHARISGHHVLVSIGKQAVRAGKNGALHNFGFHQYRTDQHGNPYPDGRRKIQVWYLQVSDGRGGIRGMKNHVRVVGSTASTVLPFGRAAQYWARSGDASGHDVDRELAVGGTPA